MKPVILETWTESEANWGTRPDGCTLHLDEDAYKKFVEEYWIKEKERTKGIPPHEYTLHDECPKVAFVDDELYDKLIKRSDENGIRFWQHEFSKLKKENKIVFKIKDI